MRALIVGLSGVDLTAAEAAFLRRVRPWGVILFARNVDSPEQLMRLTGAARDALERPDAPVFVDQEGGRVQRLRPPHWPDYPAARTIGNLFDRNPEAGDRVAWLQGRLIASDIEPLGITSSCLPDLDLAVPGTHRVIGDRAFHADPQVVARLGGAAARGLLAGGCLPVMKHIPGHGRVEVDSHESLPVVRTAAADLEAADFVPFAAHADMAMGMTAHIVYTSLDADNPATLSHRIIAEVIRGRIGFDGLLMTDDISMGALQGDIASRGQQALGAGCDVVLHCNGLMHEMEALASVVPELTDRSLARADAVLARRGAPEPFSREPALAELMALTSEGGAS